eukprot:6238816-Pyramimonas_sp.AAC.1
MPGERMQAPWTPMSRLLERGWPSRAGKSGPRRQKCNGTLGKVTHPYYRLRLYSPPPRPPA